jgi:membrane-associated protease RseP (regulator of RpoE activity)
MFRFISLGLIFFIIGSHFQELQSFKHTLKKFSFTHVSTADLEKKQQHGLKLNLVPQSLSSVLTSISVVASVVAIHEAGHFLAAKVQGIKIQSYNIGYGPKILSVNDSSSNIEYALRAFPFGGYVAFPANEERNAEGDVIRELEDPDLLQNRPPLQRLWVISAGVIANILLTFGLSFATAWFNGINTPIFDSGLKIVNVASQTSPAYQAGLRTNDRIMKVNDQIWKGSSTSVQEFVSYIRTHEYQPIRLDLIRAGDGQETSLTVIPQKNDQGKVSIGLAIQPIIKEVISKKATNLFEAVNMGAETTKDLFTIIGRTLILAITTR